MNAKKGHGAPRHGWLRIPLLLLAASTLGGSLWALPFPRSFYDDFPVSGWDWVSTLGPYNEHLVRDYGAMNLALGVLLVSAAIFLEWRLTRVALITLLVFAAPHFFFHLTETHHFTPFQNLAQLGGLGFQVLLPLILLALSETRGGNHGHRPAARRDLKAAVAGRKTGPPGGRRS